MRWEQMKKQCIVPVVVLSVAIGMLSPAVSEAAKVKINKKKVVLEEGGTVKLKITGTKKRVKWTSGNKKVATVNSKGKVKAKKEGKATIQAKVGKKKYSCKIIVKKPVAPTEAVVETPAPVVPTVAPTENVVPTIVPTASASPTDGSGLGDNAYQKIPNGYLGENEKKGNIVEFAYTARFHDGTEGTYEKKALVYLPYGYDENDTTKKYNVIYLQHGGGDSPEWYFYGVGGQTQVKKLLDNLIANGDMEPTIVCATNYRIEGKDESYSSYNFYQELYYDVMPAFESKYHTYAEDTTEEGFKNSRTHRAFCGFSMGAATTWTVFENLLDSFAYFAPLSGDCWSISGTAEEKAAYLAEKVKASQWTSKDFVIYAASGGETDLAYSSLSALAGAMEKETDVFVKCDNFKDGNFYYCVYEKGGHDIYCVTRLLYNAWTKLFKVI